MNYKTLIISILLGGFMIIGGSVYIGYSLRDGEVVNDAYESGIHFDETIKKQAQLGWRVELPRTLKTGKEDVSILAVAVKDRSGRGLKNATVSLEMNRMGSRSVRTYQCTGADGRYTVPIAFDAPGYWETRVHIARGEDTLTFDDTINIVR
jgi:nitrogen fixation protein FixH